MNRQVKIGYIGGGSMGWAWSVMKDLVLEPQLHGEIRLYDIDHASAKMNETIGNRLNDHSDALSKWQYQYAPTLEACLTGVDFVIISILPGTFDDMESDVVTPEAYGIYQSVGDTTGPAGIIRALRTVPMLEVMAHAIRDYSPNAWVINYTNPMAACVSALYTAFPQIKAFGCCHEVFHTQLLFWKLIELETGQQVNKADIQLNIIGVNHFTWVNQADYKDMDLMPLFDKYARLYANTGLSLWDGDMDADNMFRNANRVCFDLYLKYGAIPAAGDRHIAEFMPPWYLKDEATANAWGFALTPVAKRKEWRVNLEEKRAKILAGEEPFDPHRSGEEGTKLMKALLGITPLITNANLPNIGQNEDLPLGIMVESNAVFARDSVRPICAGKLPDAAHLLVQKAARQQASLMRACLAKDINLAFAVFMEDNLVPLDVTAGAELFVKMLRNTRKYLDGWDIDGFAAKMRITT